MQHLFLQLKFAYCINRGIHDNNGNENIIKAAGVYVIKNA